MRASVQPRTRFLARAEDWFNRARASLLGAIPCRQGCSSCCIGPFAITTLDAAELQRGLTTLEQPVRQEIQNRALGQAREIEAACPRLKESPFLDGWSDLEVDRLAERFASLPCPALHSDGSCLVYTFRPATCRTMGIPIEKDGLVQGACSVQTFVPIIRLTRSLRNEEQTLAAQEAIAIDFRRRTAREAGEEMLLAYGFLPPFESGQTQERCDKVSASLLEADAPVAQRIEH